ncbi:MAG: hypothetical protein ABEI53_01975, partial [Candidatus Magasanikbacteria bacterium]
GVSAYNPPDKKVAKTDSTETKTKKPPPPPDPSKDKKKVSFELVGKCKKLASQFPVAHPSSGIVELKQGDSFVIPLLKERWSPEIESRNALHWVSLRPSGNIGGEKVKLEHEGIRVVPPGTHLQLKSLQDLGKFKPLKGENCVFITTQKKILESVK